MVNPPANNRENENQLSAAQRREEELEKIKKDATNTAIDTQLKILIDAENTATDITHLGGEVESTILQDEVVSLQYTNFDQQINYLQTHCQDKTIDDIQKKGSEAEQLALASTTFEIWLGAMGSVLKALISKHQPNWEKEWFSSEDVATITDTFKAYDLSNLEGLQWAITHSGADTSQEQILLQFLKGGSPLAQDIIKKSFPRIAGEFQNNASSFLWSYTTLTEKTSEEKKTLGKEVTQARSNLRKKDERKDKPLQNTLVAGGLITGGIIFYKGLKKLFGIWKEESKNWSTDKNKKKRYQKWFLKWLLGWATAGTLFHRWMTGKRWRDGMMDGDASNDTGVVDTFENTEDAVKSFEQSPHKNNYNYLWGQINRYYSLGSSSSTRSSALGAGKDTYPWVIPHVLDNSFGSIDDIQSLNGIKNLLVMKERVDIKEYFKDLIANGAGKAVWYIGKMLWMPFLLNGKTVSNKLENWLKADNNLQEMQSLMRKFMHTVSYTTALQDIYLEKKLLKEVAWGTIVYKWNKIVDINPSKANKVNALIQNITKNPWSYTIGSTAWEDFVAHFRERKYHEVVALIKEFDISSSEVLENNVSLTEDLEDISNEEQEVLKNLQEDKEATLDKLSKDTEKQVKKVFQHAFLEAFPLWYIFHGDEIWQDSLEKWSGYKDMLLGFQKTFAELKNESDPKKIKAKIHEYFDFLREVRTSDVNIDKTIDDNGNRVTSVSLGTTVAVNKSFRNIWVGFTFVRDGNLPDKLYGVGMMIGSTYSANLFTNASLRIARAILIKPMAGMRVRWITSLAMKSVGTVLDIPTKYALKASNRATGMNKVPSLAKGIYHRLKPGAAELASKAVWRMSPKSIQATHQAMLELSPYMRSIANNPSVSTTMRVEAAAAQDIIEEGTQALAQGKNLANVTPKFLMNNILKQFVRYLPVIAEVGATIWEYIELGKQIDYYSTYNIERASNKRDERLTKTVVRLTGAGIMAFGITNGWNPLGRWIMTIGAWVEVYNQTIGVYYDILDKYYQNFEDFKNKHMGVTKQAIVSYLAGTEDVQKWAKVQLTEIIGKVTGKNKEIQNNIVKGDTIHEALQALIYLEEIAKEPLATINLQDIVNVGSEEEYKKLAEAHAAAYRRVHQRKQERYVYLRDTYLSKDSPISAETLKSGQGIDTLEMMLTASRTYSTMQQDESYTGEKTNIMTYRRDKLAQLQTKYPTIITAVEDMRSKTTWNDEVSSQDEQRRYFYQLNHFFLAQAQNLDIAPDIASQAQALDEYFKLIISSTPSTEYPSYTSQHPDMAAYEQFLRTGEWEPTSYATEHIGEHVKMGHIPFMSQDMIARSYDISAHIGQNILFDIMHDLYGYQGANDLTQLQTFFSTSDWKDKGIWYDFSNNSFVFDGHDFSLWWVVGSAIIPGGMGIIHAGNEISKEASRKFSLNVDSLNNIEQIKLLLAYMEKAGLHISSDTWSATPALSLERTRHATDIIQEHLTAREQQTQTKQEIIDYVTQYSQGNYISLTLRPDLLRTGTQAWLENLGMFVYKIEDGKLISAAILEEYKELPCPLTDEVTLIDAKIEHQLPTIVQTIDKQYTQISNLLTLNDNDLDVSEQITNYIQAKQWARITKKKELRLFMGSISPEQLQSALEYEKEKVTTIYLSLLTSAIMSKHSNDLDQKADLERFFSLARMEGNYIHNDNGTISCLLFTGNDDLEDTFQELILTEKPPGSDLSLSLLLQSQDPTEVALGMTYTKLLVKLMTEATITRQDTDGNITGLYGRGSRSFKKSSFERLKKKYWKQATPVSVNYV